MSNMLRVSESNLVRSLVTILRDERTQGAEFRDTIDRVTTLLLADVLAYVPVQQTTVRTPLGVLADGHKLHPDHMVGLVTIFRAGLAMMPAASRFLPVSPVFHLGLARDENTAEAQWYYKKLPDGKKHKWVLLLDPMLATGGSAISAIKALKNWGAEKITLIGIIGAKAGVEAVHFLYPDVDIYLAALDEKLDERKYIVPGLGDAGDRIFGTNY